MEQFPTATASGTVTCEGTPVANVRVYFSPKSTGDSSLAGKSGWGTTTDDGNFVISTYGEQDGAVIGTHDVRVGSPHPERFPDFTCECRTDGNATITTVEVTADGANIFAIELPPKSGQKRGPRVSNEDFDDIKDAED